MIRAIVVDDERPSVNKMAKLLSSSGMVDVKGKFTNPEEALEYTKNTKIDAAFLDIEMPDMDGFTLAHHMLDLQSWIAVVFVTAYNEYAVEAFRLNALDYLLKPVNKERLKETLDRIIKEKSIHLHSARLQVHCFSKFKAFTDSGEIKFRTSKAEELLAFLIDRWGSKVSRNEIIDHLWPEYDGDRAVSHFNTTLYYVRKALLNSGIDAPIGHSRGSYLLKTDSIECDYRKFISLPAAPNSITDMNISEYEKTAVLYTGDYLKDNDFQWAIRNRIMLKEKYIQMILDMADYYKLGGEYKQLIELLKTGLKHEPLHTVMNYRLIETLIELNDCINAAQYYKMYRQALKAELGLEPDAMFQKLFNKLP